MKRLMMACVNGRRTIASDTFTRSNGAIGTAELGGAWVVPVGSVNVSSNQAKGTSNNSNYAALLIPQLDYEVSADVTWYTGEILAIVLRGSSSNDDSQMRARIIGTEITITKRLSGTNTTLATYSSTWTSGTTKNVKISCYGNVFTCYLNGTQILTATDDNATKTQQYAGFLASKSAAVPASLFDNFLVMG